MKFRISVPVVVFCTAVGAITVDPTQTLVENDQVKVIRAYEKPHVKGNFHAHAQNRVLIYLESGRQRFEYQDGRTPQVFDWRAGEVKWSPADGMHSPEVVSDSPFNIIEVELKKEGPGNAINSKLDPLKADPKHYKLEFKNPQVRVLRVNIEPHGVAPMHEHSVNRTTVFLTDQDFRVTDSHGQATLVKHRAGEAVWGTPTTHMEQNLSDAPFEAVAVEIKNQH